MAMDIVFSPKYLWMVKIYIWKCLEISLRIPLSQRLPPGVHKRNALPPKVAGTKVKNDAIYGALQAPFSK